MRSSTPSRSLFAPLGITDVIWRRDPQGIPHWRLWPVHAAARHGQDRLLVPARWPWAGQTAVAIGLGPQAPAIPGSTCRLGSFRYANGWWTLPDKRGYMAVGFLRQLIIVLPEIDTVAVVTGRKRYLFNELIDRIVDAARSPVPLAADALGSARLAERIADAGVEKRSPVTPTSGLASAISGKTYRFAANVVGLRSLKLDLTPGNARYDATFATAGPSAPPRRFEGPLGLDGLFRLRDPQGSEPPLAAKGNWLGDSAFQVIVRSLPEGIVSSYRLTFNGQRVDVSFDDNRGVRARFSGSSRRLRVVRARATSCGLRAHRAPRARSAHVGRST